MTARYFPTVQIHDGGGKLDLPIRFEARAQFRVIDELVTRKIIRHRAAIAWSVHLIVAAQGVGAGAGTHVVPGHKQQVRNGG